MRLIVRDVDEQGWLEAAGALGREADLVSLWGDEGAMRMALGWRDPRALDVLRLACPEKRFPSVGAVHPAAIRLERAAVDLYGLTATRASDERPWLDHGRWPVSAPLGVAAPHAGEGRGYAFLPAEGHGLHQIPVGPVHAGVIEPGHFRFHASGETVARLEERFGYLHKGVDALMHGADIPRAATLAGRISGDSTAAYALAFARAVEQALGVTVPPRAQYLRGVIAEMERVANHLGDIGAIANDAAFAFLQAQASALRERALRAAASAFGHRLMMDAIVPGGLANDLPRGEIATLRAFVKTLRAALPRLVAVYDQTTSLQDRTVRTGVLKKALAVEFAAGGYVGRASGRDFDARRDCPYPPYETAHWRVASHVDGDVNARVWVRFDEIVESLSLIEAFVGAPPAGVVRVPLPRVGEPREGFARVEGFRGDVFAHVRLSSEQIVERAHLRDPSWFQWPLLEAAIEGNIVADFPLCNKSFNGYYSGVDL